MKRCIVEACRYTEGRDTEGTTWLELVIVPMDIEAIPSPVSCLATDQAYQDHRAQHEQGADMLALHLQSIYF